MSKAAPKPVLEELHDALARAMKAKVDAGDLDAATMNAIRQFLKDNNIEAPVGGTEATNELKAALTKLPFGEDPRDLTPAKIGKAH
jgi:Xaa-Pro aminopeptidase